MLYHGSVITDAELMERFISQRDDAAFEALVRRHGPMVLSVCRRVLHNEADVEDCFQATFLVLVRRAASLRRRGLVGNWLYGVARNAALKARAMRNLRHRKEKEAGVQKVQEQVAEVADTSATLQELLDQELQALPDKYRAAIVLCDLEGKTALAASRELGCKRGALSVRLVRGRAMLARRLMRKGVTLGAGAVAAALARNAASASMPLPLVASTVKAASLIAAGQAISGAVGAKVAALTEGVLKAMLMTKIKVALAVVLTLNLIGAGVGLVYCQTAGSGQDKGGGPPTAQEKADVPMPADQQPPDAIVKNNKEITNSIGLKLVLIPSGKFTMGLPKDEKDRPPDETQHEVEISKPFYLGKYTVTVGQFRQFVKDTGYKTEAEKGHEIGWGWNADKKSFEGGKEYTWQNPGWEQTDDHPVVNATWNDAVAFCEWLSKKEGQKYRLPTEAEWEYSCRAGTKTRFYSGDNEETLKGVANIADASFNQKYSDTSWAVAWDDGYPFTAPVGKFKPNAFSLYDMHGNVRQWCQDWYGTYPQGKVTDPQGPLVSYSRCKAGNVSHSVRVQT